MLSHRFNVLLMFSVLFVWTTSCGPAVYEVIKKKNSKNSQTDTPTHAGPTLPTTPPAGPTARVQVILGDRSVTKVKVNEPVSIRPSADTVDPNYLGISSCSNPGIAKAVYDIPSEVGKEVNRGTNCDALAIPHTFSRPGEYIINLQVTSLDNETATASMLLLVVDANAAATNDGGFTIAANPAVANPGATITFTARCESATQTTITWQFGDGATATGPVATHVYAKPGPFKVDSVCTDAQGKQKKAHITVSIITNAVVGLPVEPALEVFTATATATATSSAGQSPGQVGQNPTCIATGQRLCR